MFIVWDGTVCVCVGISDIWVVAVCFTGTAAAAALECVRPANFTQSSLSEISHFLSTSIDSALLLCELDFEVGTSRSEQLLSIHSQRANGIAC